MATKRVFAIVLVLLVTLGIGFALLVDRKAALIGPTNDVTVSTIDDSTLQLSALRGKVVMLMFWATSCAICVAEMPDLVETYGRYKPSGFEVIAVAMSYDTQDRVRQFVSAKDLPFPVVRDGTGDLARSFSVAVVPTTFVMDKSGAVLSRTLGAIDFRKLHDYLDKTLAGMVPVSAMMLPPEKAFSLKVSVSAPNTLVAEFVPAPKHYIYRNEIRFTLQNANGVQIRDVLLPAGEAKEDPYFGTVEILNKPARIEIALERPSGASRITLVATFLGCNGQLQICYPPIERTFDLTLP